MKSIVFAFAVLLAGVSAQPDSTTRINERFVDGIILGVIEDLTNDIKARGLDPFVFEKADATYRLPVTDLLKLDAAIEDVLVEGLSNIKVNDVNYSILTTRVKLDLSLPLVSASLGSSSAAVKVLSADFDGQLSGSFAIEEIRLKVNVRVRISIFGGITIRSLDVELSIKNIKSNLNLVINGNDWSETVNTLLGETIHNDLIKHSNDINKLIAHVAKEIIADLL